MKEISVLVEACDSARLALVLDASATSSESRVAFLRLAQDLLTGLPEEAEPLVFFLGSGRAYPARNLAQEAEAWWAANAGRARLLRPVYEGLEGRGDVQVVVLAAGAVFDVADWAGTSLLERTLFAGGVSAGGGYGTEVSPSPEELRSFLWDPVARVEVGGRAVMPFCWDNPAYRLDGTRLVADAEGTDRRPAGLGVRVALLNAADGPVEVVGSTRGRRRRELKARACALPAAPAWQDLPLPEAQVFSQSTATGSYDCPHGPHRHPAGELVCQAGGPVYPTLQKACGRGFVVLRERGGRAQYRLHPWPALRVGIEAVAVRREDDATVYTFDASSGHWRSDGAAWRAYQPATVDGTQAYVVVL